MHFDGNECSRACTQIKTLLVEFCIQLDDEAGNCLVFPVSCPALLLCEDTGDVTPYCE